MSWGKDPTKWGKPLTTRFEADDLARLDWLVAHYGRETHAKSPTRGSTTLKALREIYTQQGGPAIASQTDDRQLGLLNEMVDDTVREALADARSEREGIKASLSDEDKALVEELSQCSAQDGRPGPKNGPCILGKGHSGHHSNGRRTWSGKRRRPTRAARSRKKQPRQTRGPARKTRKAKKAARRGGSR